jgi:hypothetical protein
MTFDDDGRLFITDTGWNSYEEINQAGPGANFGWPFFEGGDFGAVAQTPTYRDFAEAPAFYQAVANGTIATTTPFRAFAHANAAPGFQVQSIVGGDAIYNGSSYPAELRNDYFFIDYTHSEIFAVDVNDRRDVKFVSAQSDGSMPVYLTIGPDGLVWYADIAKGEIGRLHIEGRKVFIDLDATQATYSGTRHPEIYAVDAASDSTSAQLDRITALDVAGGDRVNFTAMGWQSGDLTLTRVNVGQAGEFTRVAGPNGFVLRIDEPLPDLAGAFVFATPGNRAPVAVGDAASTNVGAPVTINVLANDSDPDGNALGIAGFAPVTANNGLVEQVGNAFVYRPAIGFVGIDRFSYAVSDGNGVDIADVTVTVNALPARIVNLGPTQATYAGTPAADIYVVDAASDSTLVLLDRIGNLDVASGDRVDFTATGWDSGDFIFRRFGVGQPHEFTRLDGPGGFALRIEERLPDLAGAFVFGAPGNRPPTAVDDVAASTGAAVAINVLANDGDPDGDALLIGSFDATSAGGGTVARSGNALVYTPAAGFSGSDSFDYVLSDGQATDVGRVVVSVTAPPVGNVVNLGPAQATYAGTPGADIYVVDAASDSTLALLDRIGNLDVAAGDRVDFTATGWDSGDFIFRRFGVGQPHEFTRLDGPDGFELRINERLPDLAGAFVFAGDAIL